MSDFLILNTLTCEGRLLRGLCTFWLRKLFLLSLRALRAAERGVEFEEMAVRVEVGRWNRH